MQYRVRNDGQDGRHVETRIAVVGCGGTGGFVAEGLCRLLGDQPAKLVLIDMDRVEPHNLRRQSFYQGDVGGFKSQVLAERLSRLYGREIGYSVYPYTVDSHRRIFGAYGKRGLVLGCVDNPLARAAIAEGMKSTGAWVWWLDAGNGHHSGQMLIGNTGVPDQLKGAFHKDGLCTHVPLPSLQLPSLLSPVQDDEEAPALAVDCAEAVEAGDQSAVINQAMASIVVMDTASSAEITSFSEKKLIPAVNTANASGTRNDLVSQTAFTMIS
ncbi:hypothetical protein LCGC14_2599490 [marine sediment metagenome]|uniref:THIF-type NAD/FAD binding fold domain-containing protein n=1 Tax=marine sediment metagenome TaxID=412755 RepID=A0A0F9CK48_9ZZZZ